jgi:dihydroorotase
VLEHATTRAAVDCVKSLGDTIACTITAHHLALTVDDWAGQSWHFCKPVAKFPDDRQALRDIIAEGLYTQAMIVFTIFICSFAGHPRFFLGSDSAPHPPHTKSSSTPQSACAAGVYTSPILLPLCAHLLESFGALDQLPGFVGGFGRRFYGRPAPAGKKVTIQRVKNDIIPAEYALGEEKVVAFWAGKPLNWKIV